MTHQPETARELASLAVNAGRALQDEKRHYEIACQENARLRAALERIHQMTDYWEQHLPEVIRTPAVVSALRAAMERAEPAVVSAAVAPPTTTTHGLSVQHADALWDAVAIPGPRTPTYPEQHERVCRAVREILDELTPAPAEDTDRAALRDRIAAALYERERPPLAPHWADALAADREVFQAMADAVLAELPEPTERAAAPVCRDEEGCHRVVPCDPGCGTRDLLAEATRPMPEPATRTIAEAALAAVETALGDTLLPDAREEALDRLMKVLPKPTDRSAVLADAESAIRTATGNCGYKAEDGCDFCNGVDAALDKLRRMADETATETPAVDQATVDRALDALRSGNHITARLLLESAMDPAAGARQDGAET